MKMAVLVPTVIVLSPYMYPSPKNYPLHDWLLGNEETITVSGGAFAFQQKR